MTAAPAKSIESKIRDALNYIWATTGKIDLEKFVIGVGFVGWGELGAEDDTMELTFTSFGKEFQVHPISGLDDREVALIWR